MAWRKLGWVFAPSGTKSWARSHAAFPTAVLRDDANTVRVYFTALDADSFGRGGYVDLDARDPLRVMAESDEPILDVGARGDFDDAGVNPYAVVELGGRRLMYYSGWQRTARAPFQIFTGVAVEQSDGRFRPLSRAPVLDRTPEERHLRSAACVLPCATGLVAWYMASSHWVEWEGGWRPTPEIRMATSSDGVSWAAHGAPVLKAGAHEHGLGRPTVVADPDGSFRMWYSRRSFGQPYEIGFARSADGVAWSRCDDEAGIVRGAAGWDGEMIGHPNVIRVGGRLLMFYNGNGQGAAGFGCAEWAA